MTIHTCSYYCTRLECVRAQRDELRDRYVEAAQPPADIVLPPIEAASLLVECGQSFVSGWTLSQVEDYASAAVLADRERR